MNILDLILIGIIIISCIIARHKGFIYTAFKTVSTLLAIFLSYIGYKPVNTILKGTGLYTWLQKSATNRIAQGMNGSTITEQTNIIQSVRLPIPNIIKENLIRNNNPEIYKVLGVDSFTEYIGGYIANFYLNIISFIVVWLLVKAILYIIGESLQIISKLPIIRVADKGMALIAGLFKGLIGCYIYTLVLAILIGFPKFQNIALLLYSSTITNWFYENNVLIGVIDKLLL